MVYSFSLFFLQATQKIFSSSENCSEFHFPFHFLIVLGFGKDLEMELMLFFEHCFIQKYEKENKTKYFHQDELFVIELRKKALIK